MIYCLLKSEKKIPFSFKWNVGESNNDIDVFNLPFAIPDDIEMKSPHIRRNASESIFARGYHFKAILKQNRFPEYLAIIINYFQIQFAVRPSIFAG